MPRRLKAEILERWRLEAEERKRAEARARRERAAAERRERERQELAERRHVISECYWRCRNEYSVRWTLAHRDFTDVWRDETFNREWPRNRPTWWLPPPALFDAMRDFLRRRDATRTWLDFDAEVPGWQEWLPLYRAGAAWPWRQPEAEAGGDDA